MTPIRFFLFAGLLVLAFTACKKDSDGFEGLRVTYNGKAWTAPTATGALVGDNISISGADASTSRTLQLIVPADITTGDYDIDVFGGVNATFSDGLSSAFFGDSGKLTVTEHDSGKKRIKGTFEFEGSSLFSGTSGTFTDGEFNVTYQ